MVGVMQVTLIVTSICCKLSCYRRWVGHPRQKATMVILVSAKTSIVIATQVCYSQVNLEQLQQPNSKHP